MSPLSLFRKLIWGDAPRSVRSRTSSAPQSPFTRSPPAQPVSTSDSKARSMPENGKPTVKPHLSIPPLHKASSEAYTELLAARLAGKAAETVRRETTQSVDLSKASFVGVQITTPSKKSVSAFRKQSGSALRQPIQEPRRGNFTFSPMMKTTELESTAGAQSSTGTASTMNDSGSMLSAKPRPRSLASKPKIRRTPRKPKPIKLFDGVVPLPWKKRKGKVTDRSYKNVHYEETSPAPSPVLKQSRKRKIGDTTYNPQTSEEASPPATPDPERRKKRCQPGVETRTSKSTVESRRLPKPQKPSVQPRESTVIVVRKVCLCSNPTHNYVDRV